MDLLRPESSPRVKLLIDREGGDRVGVDMPGTGEDVGGLIGFSYSLQSGVGPSGGTLKITNKALSDAVHESMGWQEDAGKDEVIDSPVLADHEFISKYLKSFGIVLYDGYGNQVEFSKLTATKLDYDDLTRYATAQIITVSFIDHRWKLEEHGVFLRCNCTVGNRFERHWFSADSKKPDGSPYTYRDVLEYLIKQIEISSFDGKVLLNSSELPSEYKTGNSISIHIREPIWKKRTVKGGGSGGVYKEKEVGMSHYAPDIFDVLGRSPDLGREVSDIEWTGQPLSSCINDICGKLGLQFAMLPSGDVYFYKPVTYFGLPDFDFGIPDGDESKSSGLISLSGGLEGPRVPESIVIVGARKRDQVRVFPSMDFKVPMAWRDVYGAVAKTEESLACPYNLGDYEFMREPMISQLMSERSEVDPEKYPETGKGWFAPNTEIGNFRDFLNDIIGEKRLAGGLAASTQATAGMMPISEDWPSGKVRDLNIVAKNWDIDLDTFMTGYLPAKREKVLENLLEEASDTARANDRRDLEPRIDEAAKAYRAMFDKIYNNLAKEHPQARGTSWMVEYALDATDKTEEGIRYGELVDQRKSLQEFFAGERAFEIAAKKAIMASQWFRWYRLPDYIEVKYDQESIDARSRYISEYPDHDLWSKDAKPETTGARGDFSIREIWHALHAPEGSLMGEERRGDIVGGRPDNIVSESRLPSDKRAGSAGTGTPVVVPRYFTVPWLKELNFPYWTFLSDDSEDDTPGLVDQIRRDDKARVAPEKVGVDKLSFPEPTRAEPFVWAFTTLRALYAAGFEEPVYPVLNKHVTIDTDRGYVLFNEDAPGPRLIAEDCVLGENAAYDWPLVGVEFCYERKDPSLGIHNFYHYELDADTAPGYIREIINATPPHLRHKKYVKMNEFVEMLYDGESMNKTELDNLVILAANDIWKANVRGVHGSSQFSLAFLRAGAPNNKLSNISWSLDTGGVKTDVTVGSETSGRTIEQILQAQINRMKRLELEKTPYKYSYRASPSIADALTKGEGGFTDILPPSALGSWNDENLKLMNSCHTGLLSLYDPNQDEDVLFCEATLVDDVIHKHALTKIGPLLCKQAEPRKGHIPIRGYVWWAEGEHKAGGHWYPYVLYPVDYESGPSPVPAPDPIICSCAGPVRELPLPEVDPEKYPETGKGWFAPKEACVTPTWYNYNECPDDITHPPTGADMFPEVVPEKGTRPLAPTSIYYGKKRSSSAAFAGQFRKMTDDDGKPMKTIDGNIVSAGAHLVMTYNSKTATDDKCARFRLYIATAYPGDPIDIESVAELSPDRIYVKDFTVPIKAGEEATTHITGPVKLPPSVTVNHSQYLAILARMTDSPHDTFEGPVFLTDFKWVSISDTSEFIQEPEDLTTPYESISEVCDNPSPGLYTISNIDPEESTIYVVGDCVSDLTDTGYFTVGDNMCQSGTYKLLSANYDPGSNITTVVVDTVLAALDHECPDTGGFVAPSAFAVESFDCDVNGMYCEGDVSLVLTPGTTVDIVSYPSHGQDGTYTVVSCANLPAQGLTFVELKEPLDIGCTDPAGAWELNTAAPDQFDIVHIITADNLVFLQGDATDYVKPCTTILLNTWPLSCNSSNFVVESVEYVPMINRTIVETSKLLSDTCADDEGEAEFEPTVPTHKIVDINVASREFTLVGDCTGNFAVDSECYVVTMPDGCNTKLFTVESMNYNPATRRTTVKVYAALDVCPDVDGYFTPYYGPPIVV